MAFIDSADTDNIEDVPQADSGTVRRPTDTFLRILSDDEGNATGETVRDTLGSLVGPPDLFGVSDPRLGVDGIEQQRYWHQRTPTLVDLYVYENGAWGNPRIVGFLLFMDTNQASGLTVTVQAVSSATVNVPVQFAATTNKPVVSVEFFVGNQSVGVVSGSGPYGATYTPTATGTYYVTAKGTDANGATSTSLPRQLVVNSVGVPANIKPMISLVLNPSSIQLGQATTATATAADPDGPDPTVTFYDGATPLGSRPNAPYVQSFIPTTVGQHVISSTATDNKGATTTVDRVLTVTEATSTITPDPPTQTSDDVNNTQDFDSPYGKNNIIVSIGGGTFNAYAGPYNVGNVARQLGYYQAKVKAATGRAESGLTSSPVFTYTPPVANVPDAPIIGTAVAGNGTVRVKWTAAPAGAPATTYNVYRNGGGIATATGITSSIVENGVTTYYYDDNGVTNGAPQTYRASGSNSAGEGPKSAASAAVTPSAPVSPSFNTTYNPGDNISTGTWNAAPGWLLLLNLPLSTNTAVNPATMIVNGPGGAQVGQFDYNGADSNVAAFALVNSNGGGTYTNNGQTYPGTIYYSGVMTDTAGTRTGSFLLTNGTAATS